MKLSVPQVVTGNYYNVFHDSEDNEKDSTTSSDSESDYQHLIENVPEFQPKYYYWKAKNQDDESTKTPDVQEYKGHEELKEEENLDECSHGSSLFSCEESKQDYKTHQITIENVPTEQKFCEQKTCVTRPDPTGNETYLSDKDAKLSPCVQ